MAQRGLANAAFVYIITNRAHRLYTGATTDLISRIRQHRHKTYPNAFTARYSFYRPVYYEPHPTYEAALLRERQIKGWRREKRVALIQSVNPRWNDLSADFVDLLMPR